MFINEIFNVHWKQNRQFTDHEWKKFISFANKVVKKADATGIKTKLKVTNDDFILSDKTKDKNDIFKFNKLFQQANYCQVGLKTLTPYGKVVATLLWYAHQLLGGDLLIGASDPSIFKNYFGDSIKKPKFPSNLAKQSNWKDYSLHSLWKQIESDWDNVVVKNKNKIYTFPVVADIDKKNLGQLVRLAKGYEMVYGLEKMGSRTVKMKTVEKGKKKWHKKIPFLWAYGPNIEVAAKNIKGVVTSESLMIETSNEISFDKMISIVKAKEKEWRAKELGVFVFSQKNKAFITAFTPEYKMPYWERLTHHKTKTVVKNKNLMEFMPLLIGIGKNLSDAKKNIVYTVDEENVICTTCGTRINENYCLCDLDLLTEEHIDISSLVADGVITPQEQKILETTARWMYQIANEQKKLAELKKQINYLKADAIPILQAVGKFEVKQLRKTLGEAAAGITELQQSWVALDSANKKFSLLLQRDGTQLKRDYIHEMVNLFSKLTLQNKAIFEKRFLNLVDGIAQLHAQVISEELANILKRNKINENLFANLKKLIVTLFTKIKLNVSGLLKATKENNKNIKDFNKKLKKPIWEDILPNNFVNNIITEAKQNTKTAYKKLLTTKKAVAKAAKEGKLDLDPRLSQNVEAIFGMCEAVINQYHATKEKIAQIKRDQEQLEKKYKISFTDLVNKIDPEWGKANIPGNQYDEMLETIGSDPVVENMIIVCSDGLEVKFKRNKQYSNIKEVSDLYRAMMGTNGNGPLPEVRALTNQAKKLIDAAYNANKETIMAMEPLLASDKALLLQTESISNIITKAFNKVKKVFGKLFSSYNRYKIRQQKAAASTTKLQTFFNSTN